LRKYTLEVADWLRGGGPVTHLPQQPSPHPVPIYLAALTSQNVELAGEIADGVMPLWWSVERVARSRRWIERGHPAGAASWNWRLACRPTLATIPMRCSVPRVPISDFSPACRSFSV